MSPTPPAQERTAPQISSIDYTDERATRIALAFTFAAAVLYFYDLSHATLSHGGDFDALACFFHSLPQLLFALPAALGLIVLAGARGRYWLQRRPGPPLLWSLIADLVPASIPIGLIPPLFSGPAIATSPWRWPLMLVTALAVFAAIRLALWISALVERLLERHQRIRRAILLLGYFAIVTAGVTALRLTTIHVLRGLYNAFHLGLTLTALGLIASFIHGLLKALGIRYNSRRIAFALVGVVAVLLPVGLLTAHKYPLSNQLLVEHAAFAPSYLGTVLRTEHHMLRWLKAERALAVEATDDHSPPLWSARFPKGSPRRSVVLITVDSLRGDTLEPGGRFAVHTPRLQRLADESLNYRMAYAPSSHTTRSIPSILTGQFVQQPADVHLEDLVSRAFARGGYHTECFFTGYRLPVAATRLKHLISAGFAFDSHQMVQAGVDEILPRLTQAIAQQRDPVFVWAHLIDTHSVFFTKPIRPLGTERVTYETQVAHLDRALAPFFKQLSQDRPDLIWSLSGDHGEALGEHSRYHHGGIPYDEQVRVPLVIGGAQVAPHSFGEPVSLLDLPSTLLHLAGADFDQDVPLLPLSSDSRARVRREVFTAGGSACAIVEWPWKLIADPESASLMLFDLESDPGELHNLVSDHQRRALDLLARLGPAGCRADLSVFPVI